MLDDLDTFCRERFEEAEDYEYISLAECLSAMEDADPDEGGLYDRTHAAAVGFGLLNRKPTATVEDLRQALANADSPKKERPCPK